jgi:hypothetical protein
VKEQLEYCRSTLEMIYNTIFHWNLAIQGLDVVLRRLSHAEDIRRFVRIQLLAGAKFALAWVLVHNSRLDLDALSRVLPSHRYPRGLVWTSFKRRLVNELYELCRSC